MWRAAGQLGIDPDAAASADLGGLAAIGSQVEFRHPLIRSVVYHTMPLRQRRLIHRALAAAGDGSEPDRVAWHLGMAAAGPDEAVAARLEQAAGRARDRGGYAATVMFLSRAAELSADAGLRAGRLLAAAEAALIAGQPVRAGVLLEAATPKLGDPLARAQARRLHGTIRCALGHAMRPRRSCWRRRVRWRHTTRAVPARRCSKRSKRPCSPAGPPVRRSCPRSRPRRARCRAYRSRRPRRLICCWTASLPVRPVIPRPCRYSATPRCSAPASSARERAYADSRSAALPQRSCGTTRLSTRWPAAGSGSPATMGR